MMFLFLPPATKLGQGNIFRSVCQEFCSHPGAVHAGRYEKQAGSTDPTGMHTCLGIVTDVYDQISIVRVDDWTVERAIIASNALIQSLFPMTQI